MSTIDASARPESSSLSESVDAAGARTSSSIPRRPSMPSRAAA